PTSIYSLSLHDALPISGLLGRASALLPVARDTRGDDVLPGLASALRDRNHVVEREVLRMVARPAILAGIPVARVDVRPRERHVVDRKSTRLNSSHVKIS